MPDNPQIMRYIFLTCSLLVLVNHSGSALEIKQLPRFYGVKVGRQVAFMCSSNDNQGFEPEWYKVKKFTDRAKVFNQQVRPFINPRMTKTMGHLIIKQVTVEDTGFYFCRINHTWGLGSELQVFRHTNLRNTEWRSNMKDMIIFLQGLLLALCIILPLVRFFTLEKKDEAEYEEPIEDHTYEGLEIEQCQDLYEDLTAYSQIPDTDASWQVESPGQS